MIVYALFLTEEAKGKQERMCAVAQNFFQEFGDDLHRLIFGIEEKAYKDHIPVSKPEFLIGIFKTLWLMEVFGGRTAPVSDRFYVGDVRSGSGGVFHTDHLV